MKKIEMILGNTKLTFAIDKIKVIKGSNYWLKYTMYQLIKGKCKKKSEYQIEQYQQNVLINGDELRIKTESIFDVHPFFSLEDDLKLGTKSLSYRYINCILEDEVFFDVKNTIQILLQTFEEELNSVDDNFKINLAECTNSMLIKFMKPYFMVDGYVVNESDLNYEQHLLFQLKMVKRIIEQSLNDTILLINVEELTTSLLEEIKTIKSTYTLIFTTHSCVIQDLNMLYYVNKNNVFDFSDLSFMYESICLNTGYLWSEEELKMNLIDYFNGIRNEQTIIIDNQINK